jgi:hypothetical protein
MDKALIIESLVNTSDATLQRRRAYVPSLIEPAALRGGGFFFWASGGARSLLQLVGSSPSDDFAKDRMTSL